MTRGTPHPWRPVFDHLAALTDERGLFEHALLTSPRREHGYCLDDAARGLIVTCRETKPDARVLSLQRRYLDFVLRAIESDGTCHNRMDVDGCWTDESGVGDWWGRAVWALGTAACSSQSTSTRAAALGGFRIAAQQRSPHARSMTFAALGAATVLRERPEHLASRQLLRDAVIEIGSARGNEEWPWPEARLRYANGSVVEALLVAGELFRDPRLLTRALTMLRFLVRVETSDGRLSVTPASGRGPSDAQPAFDQQPIEVGTLADACATAYRITLDPQWLHAINLAWRWFLGENDAGVPMFDERTGAGYDGLEPDGRNLNRGAESTLAVLSTAQHMERVRALR